MSKKNSSNISLAKVFRTIIWPRRGPLLIGLLLIILSRMAALVLPGASRYLLDDVVPNKDYQLLYTILIVVFVAILTQALSSFLLTRILSVEAQHLIAQLRAKIQRHVLALPIHFFDNNKSGGLVSRIMTDVDGVRNLVGTGVVHMIGGIFTAVVSMIILTNISPMMTLYSIIPVSIYVVVVIWMYRYIRPIFRKRRVIRAEVTGRLNESIGGIRVIKGFNAEEFEATAFEKGVNRLYLNIKKTLTTTALVSSLSTLLQGIASVGVMWIAARLMIDDQLSDGEFLSFILYLGLMVNPLIQMGNIGTQLTEAVAGLDRTEELMRQAIENNPEKRTQQLENIKGQLIFDQVSFAYEEEVDVLHGISFEAPQGSVTALVGSSGSGKSTIAGLVAGFLHDYRGNITVDGVDLSTIDLASYRRQLGLVLQDDFLFEGTIRENILLANADASEEELQAAVAAAYVNEFTDRFEKGLETVIGERGVKLSGGQKQRIAIARAILANPRILILDEATSNLDTESEMLIQKALAELMKGRTTFVIAHRLSTIRKADQILVIEQGHIVERGRHEELLKTEGRYHQLHTYQARI
jgi:ABC-type multidrug transport system fused ATPase/permease subunit